VTTRDPIKVDVAKALDDPRWHEELRTLYAGRIVFAALASLTEAVRTRKPVSVIAAEFPLRVRDNPFEVRVIVASGKVGIDEKSATLANALSEIDESTLTEIMRLLHAYGDKSELALERALSEYWYAAHDRGEL